MLETTNPWGVTEAWLPLVIQRVLSEYLATDASSPERHGLRTQLWASLDRWHVSESKGLSRLLAELAAPDLFLSHGIAAFKLPPIQIETIKHTAEVWVHMDGRAAILSEERFGDKEPFGDNVCRVFTDGWTHAAIVPQFGCPGLASTGLLRHPWDTPLQSCEAPFRELTQTGYPVLLINLPFPHAETGARGIMGCLSTSTQEVWDTPSSDVILSAILYVKCCFLDFITSALFDHVYIRKTSAELLTQQLVNENGPTELQCCQLELDL